MPTVEDILKMLNDKFYREEENLWNLWSYSETFDRFEDGYSCDVIGVFKDGYYCKPCLKFEEEKMIMKYYIFRSEQ